MVGFAASLSVAVGVPVAAGLKSVPQTSDTSLNVEIVGGLVSGKDNTYHIILNNSDEVIPVATKFAFILMYCCSYCGVFIK